MTDDVRTQLLAALTTVAPEIDPADVRDDEPLQEQLDLDSLDFLNFLEQVAARTGVNVPEEDLARVATLAGAVEYVTGARAG